MSQTTREKRPAGREWLELAVPAPIWMNRPIFASRWQRGSIIAISTLVVVELPGTKGESGPTWHVSITRAGKRPKPGDVALALTAFDMAEAEEDNHPPGKARSFFLPVDPAYRGICECKETEDQITEPDGYTWSNPSVDAVEPCRGCWLAQAIRGRRCPIHSDAEAAE